MKSQSETTQTVSALKLPVLKTGEYDLYRMRMEQYLTFTDHAFWEKQSRIGLEATRNQKRCRRPFSSRIMNFAASSQKGLDKTYDSTNEIVNTAHSVSATSSKDQPSTGSYTNDVMFSFFSNQSNALQLDNEDLEQIDTDDLEEMDLKWQVAMLTMRVKRFIQKRGMKLDLNGKETVGFDKTKAEKELANFALMAYTYQGSSSLSNSDSELENALKEKYDLKLKLEKFEISSKSLTKLINSQISATDKTVLGYDGQMNESNLNDILVNESEVLNNVVDSHESDEDDNQVNDRFKKSEGYHAVPLPYTGNYIPPRANLSFVGLDNYVFKSKVSETITSMPKIETNAPKTSKDSLEKPKTVRSNASIIEDWESDSEDENVFESKEVKKTVKHILENIEFVNAKNITVENENKAKKPRKFSQSPRVNYKGKITGSKEIRPVWDNTTRVNHQNKLTHPHPKRNFIPAAVLTKSGQVLVNAAKQSSYRAAASVSTVRHVNIAVSRPNVNNALPTIFSYFKAHSPLLDESQVLLKVPRNNNMYSFDLKNVVPVGGLTCLFIKSTLDESNLWHRRLGHINIKTMNKLVRENLVRGLPSKLFEDDHTCVACQNGKQHKASCKTKTAEAVKTACYVQNRVLVIKPHNKTPYELSLGKFDRKSDDGFFVGYSINCKAFRVFNTRTRFVEENLHITFLGNKPNFARIRSNWMFDIDTLTMSMNYQPVFTGNQTNGNAGTKANINTGQAGMKIVPGP
nr:ribonuclease H-like domain-containing protein [Tanacetum cinerariifolium]